MIIRDMIEKSGKDYAGYPAIRWLERKEVKEIEYQDLMQEIGVLRRVAVIDVGDGPVELVNPVILDSSGEQGGMEGCLSFPGESGYVVRPNWVKVEAYDRHGDLYEYEGEGLFARAVFHETDHLDGKVYLRLVTEPPADFKE